MPSGADAFKSMVGVALANPDLNELYGMAMYRQGAPRRVGIDGEALVRHGVQMQQAT